MEILRKKVEEEYEEDKEFVMKFFVEKNFTFKQAKELTHSLRRAVFYLRRDVDKRQKWEKKTINYIRDKQKLKIKELDIILNLKGSLENDSLSDNDRLRLEEEERALNEKAKLRREDYQLSYALDLLKGFSVLQKNN